VANGEAGGTQVKEAGRWYAAVDGDGVGDASVAGTLRACDYPPPETAPNRLDCDDSRDDVNPDQMERCVGDDVDEDCDNILDHYEAYDQVEGYCGLHGLMDPADVAAVQLGLSHVYGSVANSIAERAGDVNGDGELDVLVGVPYANTDSTIAGKVYLVHGPLSAEIDLDDAAAIIGGESYADRAGSALVAGHDFDGDRYDDVLLSAPGEDGGVYLFFGPVTGAMSLSDADLMRTDSSTLWQDVSVSSGDLNGDDDVDIALGLIDNDKSGHYKYKGYKYLSLIHISEPTRPY